MEYQAITRNFLDVQGRCQELLGEYMARIRDAENDVARGKEIILLKAIQRAEEALVSALASVDSMRPWNNLTARNSKTIDAFLEGFENGRTN